MIMSLVETFYSVRRCNFSAKKTTQIFVTSFQDSKEYIPSVYFQKSISFRNRNHRLHLFTINTHAC